MSLPIRFTIILSLVFLALWPAPSRAEKAKITFLLTNDIDLMNEQIGADGRARGGFPRLAAVVKAERAKGHVIFAHAGDTLSPSLMSGIDRGEHIISLLNMIRPDIFTAGNHEFDFGKATFFKRMGEANFPLYTANMRMPDGAPVPSFRDRGIVEIDGIRIGLTGATEEDAALLSSPGDLRFSPAVTILQEQAATLRKEGADFIVAVTHSGREKDEALYRSQAFDLILTGHDHDLLINYDGRSAIVESSSNAQYVVAIDVTIDIRTEDGRRRAIWHPQFRVIDTADVTPDPQVLAVVQDYERSLSAEFDVALAKTAVELDGRSGILRAREAVFGNVVADALRVTSGADIAIINGGGLRGDRVLPAGTEITRRHVLSVLPFGNRVVLLEIDGKGIRAALENGVSELPHTAGRFPQVSGLSLTVDPAKPAGQRIASVKVGNAPLEDGKIYKLATNDFMARGGDGYDAFAQAKTLVSAADGPLMANEVMVYLRSLGMLRAEIEGRIVFK